MAGVFPRRVLPESDGDKAELRAAFLPTRCW